MSNSDVIPFGDAYRDVVRIHTDERVKNWKPKRCGREWVNVMYKLHLAQGSIDQNGDWIPEDKE